MPFHYPRVPLQNRGHGKLPGHIESSALAAGLSVIRDASCGLDRRSQQLLTRLRARVAAGQEAGLLEPARPGQRIRSWQLREPWLAWVIGQLAREE